MPGERVSMRKIREVLRLQFAQGLSQRVIGTSLRLSTGAVNACLNRARRVRLDAACARALALGHPLIQFGRVDPEERSGQKGARARPPQPVPREHPRPRLLPLKGQTMLTHPLAERLRGLGMAAMADAFLGRSSC